MDAQHASRASKRGGESDDAFCLFCAALSTGAAAEMNENGR